MQILVKDHEFSSQRPGGHGFHIRLNYSLSPIFIHSTLKKYSAKTLKTLSCFHWFKQNWKEHFVQGGSGAPTDPLPPPPPKKINKKITQFFSLEVSTSTKCHHHHHHHVMSSQQRMQGLVKGHAFSSGRREFSGPRSTFKRPSVLGFHIKLNYSLSPISLHSSLRKYFAKALLQLVQTKQGRTLRSGSGAKPSPPPIIYRHFPPSNS